MSEEQLNRYAEKSIHQLLDALSNDAHPDSRMHQEIRGALFYRLSKMLCDSIDEHQRAAGKLANSITILNVIFGVFTVVGACFTAYQIFCQ